MSPESRRDAAAAPTGRQNGGSHDRHHGRLHADPGKEQDVRKALSAMVQDASTHHPSLPGYSLLASEDDPASFLIYAEFTSVEDRLPEAQIDELMQLRTGLCESLREPIEIERYVVVSEK